MDHASLEAANFRRDGAAAVNKRKKSSGGSMCIRWDMDNVKPGAPTSLDVLLRWLAAPGNYGRRMSQLKGKTCREIVTALNAQGIGHRTPGSVRQKVNRVERQYKSTRTWLLDSGHYDLYMRGGTDEQVEKQVQQRCTQFRKLDPVIQGASPATEVSDAEEENAGAFRARDGDAKEIRRVEASPGISRRSWATSWPDTNSNKRVKRVAASPQAPAHGFTLTLPVSAKRATINQSVPPIAAVAGSLPQDRLSEVCCGDSQTVHGVAGCEAEAHERLLACDREREQALAICEVEGLLEQRNVRLVCETAIWRHKLLKAGVSQETIDSLVRP
ncbi:hypothetical protein BBJ28_00011785 [Nothophytophthora sp. Chile5]|nr:hypothetical protein BBJ28_00011785 [Nothophytophthora sp. Chile5]